jgi:hypothetical protein
MNTKLEIKKILFDYFWDGKNTNLIKKAYKKLNKLLNQYDRYLIEKTCLWCKQNFFPSRSSQKYCAQCHGLPYYKRKEYSNDRI